MIERKSENTLESKENKINPIIKYTFKILINIFRIPKEGSSVIYFT